MCLPIGRRVQGVIHDRRSDVRGTSVLERFDDLDHKHMLPDLVSDGIENLTAS